ncbi:MAG: tryptophan--tRNA ligase [Candidatus Magasanikbacteria bacterium]|jgi:tryptophanyl-tRNA synthetase|nr:tryptophan--tRNA ligase [Candidatus Magasanikbacteria bacterium]
MKSVIFSGIQPTGNIHLGNYLGALANWVTLQNSGDYMCYFSIVDYHALTGERTAEERYAQIMVTAAELLALGIDPEKSVFFVQSHVRAHTELAWIFQSVTPMAELERMTQYKDKSQQQAKNINVGLFTYPVLQAADILLYHGTHVPVGEDQKQHIELTRDTARWFNNKYGNYFPETNVLLTNMPRVKSLLEPTKKMSKSLGDGHVIELADEPEIIEKKLKKAVTATTGGEENPGVENLLLILEHVASKDIYNTFVSQVKDDTIQYGELKQVLAQSISEKFSEFRAKRAALLQDSRLLSDMLALGADKAELVAEKTMQEVRQRIGVRT